MKPHDETRFVALDLLRGLAALLVLVSHIRAYVVQSHAGLTGSDVAVGAAWKLLYLVTGLGHQAVIVFFALSGFLVGGRAIESLSRGNFRWDRYLLRRLTRLLIVIVPALVLTAIFDRLGVVLTGGAGYDGRYYETYATGPHPADRIDLSTLSLLGNIFFLQTILVPVFGSNVPMWSLANEFWYYVIFPLAAWLFLARATWQARLFGLLVLCGLLILLPGKLLLEGSIWLAGAGAAWCTGGERLALWVRSRAGRIIAALSLLAALVATKLPGWGLSDVALGFVVAASLPFLATMGCSSPVTTAFSRALSEVSYTLYLTHFPLLTFIALVGFAPLRWAPGLEATGMFLALFVTSTVWAVLVWWCFERNTDSVHRVLTRRLFRS